MAPIRRIYEKKEPYRDARFFVIVCEGEKREPDYFGFFDRITSHIKLKIIENKDGKSSPKHLLENAFEALKSKDVNEYDELWFVLDKDRWPETQIAELINECEGNIKWNYAISNPCFEVWLFYHFNEKIPEVGNIEDCKYWKSIVNASIPGGFNSSKHPQLIVQALTNSEKNYSVKNNFPIIGATQVYLLANNILPFVKDFIESLDE